MNDCSIGSARHIGIWMGGVLFNKWQVLIQDTLTIQYHITMIIKLSMHYSIHILMRGTTVKSVMNAINSSG
jgi:hypothetical protein